MSELSLEGVKKYMDTTLVLKNITFLVTAGEKIGMVGENGCGKSTILKLIAGILTLNHCAGYPYAPVPPGFDEGWVKLSKGATCAYLEQIPQYAPNMKVIDVLNLSFEELHRIEREMRELEESMQHSDEKELKKIFAKYSELTQLYEIKGGYEAAEKLNKICKGLKFAESFLNQEFNQLSGGEKTTVILGKLLIDTPDILLLDEPTNHLDMESVEWLEEYIKNYKGIVIVVSHDRYFLDHTVTKIIEIEDKISETYLGNYSDYIKQKEENLQIQFNNYKEQNKKVNDMEQSIRELRDWAMRANNKKFFSRAASMQIKLDKMERVEKPVMKQTMKLNIKSGERSGNVVIQAENLMKSFGNRTIFKEVELLVRYGERVAFIGPNGSGKTTFLRMLLGELTPDNGVITLGANVRMAYLPQNLAFKDEELTVLDYFREDISILEGKAREQLAKFLFYGATVFKKIKLLSGGERVRLKLSKLLYQDVNLLILDEPTNHLDTGSIERIEEALSGFQGTIFFISHDRYFINKISERIIEIKDKKLVNYLGNYDYYKEMKEKQAAVENTGDNLPGTKELIGKDKGRRQDQAGTLSAQNKQTQGKTRYPHADTKDSQAVIGRAKAEEEKKLEKKLEKKPDKKLEKKSDKKSDKKPSEKSELETRVQQLEQEIKKIEVDMEAAGSDYEELGKLYSRKNDLSSELERLIEQWVNI